MRENRRTLRQVLDGGSWRSMAQSFRCLAGGVKLPCLAQVRLQQLRAVAMTRSTSLTARCMVHTTARTFCAVLARTWSIEFNFQMGATSVFAGSLRCHVPRVPQRGLEQLGEEDGLVSDRRSPQVSNVRARVVPNCIPAQLTVDGQPLCNESRAAVTTGPAAWKVEGTSRQAEKPFRKRVCGSSRLAVRQVTERERYLDDGTEWNFSSTCNSSKCGG